MSGATLAGAEVTETIRKGIVDLSSIEGLDAMNFAYVMISALLAAGAWLLFASKRGLPVSTTHSIIGGIVGSSVLLGFMSSSAANGFDVVQWSQVGMIGISWVISPILGGLVAYYIYNFINKSILFYNQEAREARHEHFKVVKDARQNHKEYMRSLGADEMAQENFNLLHDLELRVGGFYQKEELESHYFRELEELEHTLKKSNAHQIIRNRVSLVAAFGALIISSVVILKGFHHVSMEWSAELSAATVVLIASALGIPISSTHILIGAVLGIGIVNADANWSLLKPIVATWVITLPAAAFLSALIYALLSWLI